MLVVYESSSAGALHRVEPDTFPDSGKVHLDRPHRTDAG